MQNTDKSADIIVKIKELNLPADKYIVVGGASLAVRGIRETRDLDIVVAVEVFNQLASEWELDKEFKQKWGRQRLVRGNIEIYHDLYFEKAGISQSLNDLLLHADFIEGIAFQNLAHLMMCKQETAREKDLKDIELINRFLKQPTHKSFRK
jgi:hypothetical protein